MASFRAVSSEPVIATPGAAESVKYRQSCDRCQNTKVRCSQDKPTCKRCAQRGVSCVYSPLRRIGRPRKVASDDAIPDRSSESMISATPSPGDSSRLDYSTSATSLGDSGCQSDFAMADVQMIDAQVTGSSQHSVPQPNGNEEPGATCYTAILTQTIKLAQAQARTALPLGIDLVFEAERDFCTLQHRLFTCTGHDLPPPQQQQQGHSVPNSIPLQSAHSREYNQPCLASDRPVLLSLALLAEHVISMLETMFRLAASAAHTLDKTTNVELSWSGAQDGVPSASARRLQRSCRSLWANPCVSPLVEASRDLRLGEFVVENPAKSKALRRILMRRVGRMLAALRGMRRRGRGERDGDSRWVMDAPLDWGGSAEVMSDVAHTLVGDLIRRVESLQGAMVLIRNDSMI